MGFVHRDLKPANFMTGLEICEAHKIYLIDFGLAKCIDEEDESLKDGGMTKKIYDPNNKGHKKSAK